MRIFYIDLWPLIKRKYPSVRRHSDHPCVAIAADALAVQMEIDNEKCKLSAANNVGQGGRDKLDDALNEPTLKKANVVTAKTMIDMGTASFEECCAKTLTLEKKLCALKKTIQRKRKVLKKCKIKIKKI